MMDEVAAPSKSELLALTAEIVSAYVSNNTLPAPELPPMIAAVHGKLAGLGAPAEPTIELIPAVPIKKSVFDDHLICLEDGRKLKTLKRHLAGAYGLSPAEYRAKWGLPADYPMVAPAYSRKRRELAKSIGLGRRPVKPEKAKPKARRAAKR